MTDCSCAGLVFSEEACEQDVRDWVRLAREANLTYSTTCMTGLDERFSELHDYFPDYAAFCNDPPASLPDWLACADECQIYHGDVGEGGACVRYGRYMSTCAEDLSCGGDGVCHRPCDVPLVVPTGATCGYAKGFFEEHCEPSAVCARATASCVTAIGMGESCDDASSPCGEGLWCAVPPLAGAGTCQARAPVGDPCTVHEGCASLVCVGGACAEPDLPGCATPYF